MTDDIVRVLLIDDEPAMAHAMRRILDNRGFSLDVFHDPTLGLAHIGDHIDDYDVILLDVSMPVIGGLEVLARIRQLECITPVVMWTADARALTATVAIRAGAFSYTTKPVVRVDELVALLRSAASFCALKRHARALEEHVACVDRQVHPIGQSRAMATLKARVEKLARSDIGILILGESGTGKELVARSIHEVSARAHKPFIALNCGAIAESLIDSELFGHSRGAFTGATASRAGVFVEAHTGTLFLDEIGEMPLAVQTRLLRVLQEGEVRALGGEGVRHVDVRVVAATHAGLEAAVEDKRFRADLYYRLAIATVEVPPLRARMTDVPLLAAHFLRKHGGPRRAHLTPAALERLMSYAWPGNVRELENAVLHALALTSGDTIDELALPTTLGATRELPSAPRPALPDDLEWAAELSLGEAKKRAVDDFERRYVTRALERTHGNLTEAARVSGLDRSNFRRVLTRLGIDASLFRDD
ncbi:MAG: sigma-54-dependent Fis family transcriptional regulator [Deltaproteobacteria bacterium]|nr:sigma-54-dependent Fis family transcriptional regulator [Deltaproteobacteria bacterium]